MGKRSVAKKGIFVLHLPCLYNPLDQIQMGRAPNYDHILSQLQKNTKKSSFRYGVKLMIVKIINTSEIDMYVVRLCGNYDLNKIYAFCLFP